MERLLEVTPVSLLEPPAPPAEAEPLDPTRPSREARPSNRQGTWAPALAGLVLLHLTQPLTWHQPLPGAWFPAAGVGFLLVAWFGPRAAWLVAADTLLAALQAWLTGARLPWGTGWEAGLGAAGAAALAGTEAWAAWWCYHRFFRGSAGLLDPTSASLFLFLVPGLTASLFAAGHAVLFTWADLSSLPQAIRAFWLSRALGLLAVVPPALILAAPWLARRRWSRLTPAAGERSRGAPERLTVGDGLEIVGLAAGTGLLGLLLIAARREALSPGWPLWVLPVVLTVWASLRQGSRGGTVVATTPVVLALVLAPAFGAPDLLALPLQGYLLAQCSTALLVGTAFSWIQASETRYRQVVEHIPVVLYSARLVEAGAAPGRPGAVEVTFVSPACRQLFGCEPEELLVAYDAWFRHVHPADHELVRAALAELDLHQRPVTHEYRVSLPPLTADAFPASNQGTAVPEHEGLVKWVRDTLVPLTDSQGRLTGWEGLVVDITEQRLLADDLRRTTGMLHTLVAHLPAGVFFVHAPSGRPILVNARARQLLGQHEDRAAGLAHWSQVYRLYRPDGTLYPVEELPVCTALRRGLTSMRDDIVVHRPDGRRVPLITWAAPLDLKGQGRPDAAVWVLEDLTALRQAEAAHRQSEAQLRAVIETMAEALIIYDRTGIIIECNPAACAILESRPEQLCGRSVRSPDWGYLREDGSPLPVEEHPALVSLRTRQPVRGVVLGIPTGARGAAALRDCKRDARAAPEHPATLPLAHAPGSVRWLLVHAMPLTDGRDHEPARVVTTATDITPQRLALEVLKASEERYRGLVETLPVMLIQSDRAGRIAYVNPAVEELSGYGLDDLRQPAAWQALVDPEYLPRIAEARREALAGRTARLELRFRARDGSDRVCYATLQPRRQGRQVTGLTTLVVDVTAQRRLEQELQRAQRLELVGRLAGGIAHDFNNLLTIILGLADLARADVADGHPAASGLRGITDAAGQAAHLAGQLLTFSKQRRVRLRRVDLVQATRRALHLLHGVLPPAIGVELSVGPAELPVQADETQLQQVLMNLCLNARDAMPTGGRLQVQVAAVDAEPTAGSAGSAWVRLSIRDSGHGMSENIRARIFDPFFSTKEHGTGLGLAVVQQIVESYGGRIEVNSQPDVGSCFEVWLPRDG